MRIISEPEFAAEIRRILDNYKRYIEGCGWVTGPGRSGAIAAVYASHILGIPFVPQGSTAWRLGKALVIDTAMESGKTLRKMCRSVKNPVGFDPVGLAIYAEPPRVAFWYEAPKPQRYRHETELRRSFDPVT